MSRQKLNVRILHSTDIPSFLKIKSVDDYALLMIANTPQDIDTVRSHLEGLIKKYCIYFVCVGKMAEPMFDMIEATITSLELNSKIDEISSMISTVWYAHLPPEDIIKRFLKLASPATSLSLVALLGNDHYSNALKSSISRI